MVVHLHEKYERPGQLEEEVVHRRVVGGREVEILLDGRRRRRDGGGGGGDRGGQKDTPLIDKVLLNFSTIFFL